MSKVNYREKYEESLEKLKVLQTELDHLRFTIQAVKNLLKEE